MDSLFKSSNSFSSLSFRDLLEARDLFHYHLMNKKNLVATALGLYRIRKNEDWPSRSAPQSLNRPDYHAERRTLFNSEIRPYSWPCIYAFVSEWEEEERLAKEDPSDVVPRTLFLPDGRTVPVCVIETKRQAYSTDLKINSASLVPRNLLAPGVPILNEDAQGMPRLSTAGCVVRDGDRYYVLTNRHTVGAVGTEIRAMQHHRNPVIGVAAKKGLGREKFSHIYPHLASTNQYVLMDLGLIDLDDLTLWKTDFPGISPIRPVLDLYDNCFTLQLLGQKIVGNSAVSGRIRGEVHGLFYRYKAQGGAEYLSDFLIGPETHGDAVRDVTDPPDGNRSLGIHHGDSGTVLFIEHWDKPKDETERPAIVYYPFALLWGKEEFIENGVRTVHPFALATSLSTALNQLDLDFVSDLSLDQEYIWGWVGHYTIGRALPVSIALLAETDQLQKFIAKNIDLLAITPDDRVGNDPRVLESGGTDGDSPSFVPLADVPDNVWKSNVNFYQVADRDGKKRRTPGPGSRGQADNPNHFADMDLPYKQYGTFIDFNLANLSSHVKPEIWKDYYDSVRDKYDRWSKAIDKKPNPSAHWGALPFRVWQLFQEMVDADDQDKFLCAGGVLIHYVGDACQPLHTSYLSQGDPDRVVQRPRSDGKKLEADGVHSGYEDDMVNYGYMNESLASSLEQEIRRQESDRKEEIGTIDSGAAAAQAIVQLIAKTHRTIKPRDIVDKWVELHGTGKSDRNKEMWRAFGEATVQCMARGTRFLARIWQGAWTTGKGDTKIGEGTMSKPDRLMALYNDPKFVPSIRLDRYNSLFK